MAKGIIVVDMPECCITPGGRVKCPLAYNTIFCSRFSPKGMDITNGEWGEIYDQGIRPNWCPIKPMPEKACHEDYCDGGRYDKGWNDCLNEVFGRWE